MINIQLWWFIILNTNSEGILSSCVKRTKKGIIKVTFNDFSFQEYHYQQLSLKSVSKNKMMIEIQEFLFFMFWDRWLSRKLLVDFYTKTAFGEGTFFSRQIKKSIHNKLKCTPQFCSQCWYSIRVPNVRPQCMSSVCVLTLPAL